MKSKFYEKIIQDYLTKDNGLNLKKIDENLSLIDIEHKFPGGRIDILAKKSTKLIGIELKLLNYNTREICAQLLNYLNYLIPLDGQVYFVAPKIKYGIYSTLKTFYDSNKILFFEFEKHKQDYFFTKTMPSFLIDSRKTNNKLIEYDSHYEDISEKIMNEEKIKKGIQIIIKDKKKCKLIEEILDTKKSKEKQIVDITESIIDIYSRKDSSLKTIYSLLKLL